MIIDYFLSLSCWHDELTDFKYWAAHLQRISNLLTLHCPFRTLEIQSAKILEDFHICVTEEFF